MASKIIQNSQLITAGSRADKYWLENGYEDYLPYVRQQITLPKSLEFSSNPDLLRTKFGINAVGFGNWVTHEDKYNYINCLIVCLYDINKVANFDYYMGLGRLSFSFGARGHGKALAHYEPSTKIINLTRYERGEEDKIARFVATGGMGSIAHEYGHFLDYVGGEFIEPSNSIFSLTGGRTTDKNPMPCTDNQPLRKITNQILEKVIWKTKGKELSGYYKRLTLSKGTTGYYVQRNEIFARWFESWVSFKLGTNNVDNKLLSKPKYDNKNIYPTDAELREVDKLFMAFCKEFKNGYFI